MWKDILKIEPRDYFQGVLDQTLTDINNSGLKPLEVGKLIDAGVWQVRITFAHTYLDLLFHRNKIDFQFLVAGKEDMESGKDWLEDGTYYTDLNGAIEDIKIREE
jgi:beta-galactosidase beta subunit